MGGCSGRRGGEGDGLDGIMRKEEGAMEGGVRDDALRGVGEDGAEHGGLVDTAVEEEAWGKGHGTTTSKEICTISSSAEPTGRRSKGVMKKTPGQWICTTSSSGELVERRGQVWGEEVMICKGREGDRALSGGR